MLTTKLIHPDIIAALSRCGHGDQILIADGNYPAERCAHPDAARVFLGLCPGLPTVTDVLEALMSAASFEQGAVMTPGKDADEPEIFAEFRSQLGLSLTELGRQEFYDAAAHQRVRLVISTGEKRVFANLLLTVGVA